MDSSRDHERNAPLGAAESSWEAVVEIVQRFGTAAKIAQNGGFTGVQIHGAHGYLVSQFLSPLHNQRSDRWGGSFANRMRFVSEVYESIRTQVGPAFPIGIKLNSADFQRGGFTEQESLIVAQHLSELGIDLIEISGGTYESPKMTGIHQKPSTRTSEGMNQALESGACEMVGLARSLAINPEFANQILKGGKPESEVRPLSTGFKKLDALFPLEVTWYTMQLRRLGQSKDPDPKISEFRSILSTVWGLGTQTLRRVRATPDLRP